jgi:hypothetical protein
MKTKTVLIFLGLCLFQLQVLSCSKKNKNTEVPDDENPPAQTSTTSAAANYIEKCIDEENEKLYVYKNFGDGRNIYTQKSWMGETNVVSPMDEQSKGFSETGIAAELDLSKNSWGGYMIVCGILEAGQSVPGNNLGEFNAGFDLTGATKLIFHACGDEGNEKIEFILAGLGMNGNAPTSQFPDSSPRISSGVITLSKEWRQYEIDLRGKNLTRIACGFGWVTNNTNNPGKQKVKFYMDEIYYKFETSRKAPIFLKSYADKPYDSEAAIINSIAYLYDNAAAAMALSYAGKHEHARQIADAIVYAVDNDRYYSDGRLHNAYLNGNVQSFPGWMSGKNKAFARMFGFYDVQNSIWNEDIFANSSATGNMAWAIMALCEVYYNSNQQKYLAAARKIGDFVLKLNGKQNGFTGGYEGWEGEGTESQQTYLSTEHNIDLIAAYSMLFGLTNNRKYQDAAVSAKNFVLSMYDSQKKCFYTGTGNDGTTTNKSILPLDCNTWALLALQDEFQEAKQVMDFVEQNMRVNNTKGYDFNDDRDGVWFEGTAQVALSYLLAADNVDKYNEIITYLNECALQDGSIYSANKDNITTGFTVSGTLIVWKYDRRVHLGATAWLAFAQLGKNPFDVDKFMK